MIVAVCKLTIRLPENDTLKGKRQTVKSLCSRVRNKFNVSIAEIEDHDLWQLSTIGISCVSNDSRHAQRMLSQVVDYIVNMRLDLEIVNHDIEVLPGF